MKPGTVITFTGGREFDHPRGPTGFNARRYRWVKKRMDRFDVCPGTGETVVYSIGTLYGEWTDGTPFEGNRYVDRFVVKGGRDRQDGRLERQRRADPGAAGDPGFRGALLASRPSSCGAASSAGLEGSAATRRGRLSFEAPQEPRTSAMTEIIDRHDQRRAAFGSFTHPVAARLIGIGRQNVQQIPAALRASARRGRGSPPRSRWLCINPITLSASPFTSAAMIARCSLIAHSDECGRLYSDSVRQQR